MTQVIPQVKDYQAFLSRFSGKIFIRLIHSDYDISTREPARLRSRQFYGDVNQAIQYLGQHAAVLNSGDTDDHKFNVYYAANDPGQAEHARKDDIAALRVVYQDCDDVTVAMREPELAGIMAHAVVESSPGKRQRVWHHEPISPQKQRAIHDHMCAKHYHDTSTSGPARLLRLPGFRNWKYPDGPYARLVTMRDTPRMTEGQIYQAFGFRHYDQDAGNIDAGMQRIQSSGDLPDHKVYSLEKERAKRSSVIDTGIQKQARMRDAEDIRPGELPVHVLLDTLSLIEPDSGRNEWRRVLAALHYMTGDRPWGKAIAEAWSTMGLEKFNEKSFHQHWAGLDRHVSNPATWLTLNRITANKRHNQQTRALRQCKLFKEFEENYGPTLEYEQLHVEYKRFVKVEGDDGTAYRPDPRARENIQYLLKLEGIEPYYDEFRQMTMAIVDGNAVEIDQRMIMELYSTAYDTQLRVDDGFLSKQVDSIALNVKRDPVREFLSKVPAWDGVPRLHTVFQRLMGAPDTPSIRETLPLLMMAMIRRTYKPGCKFDLMPIIEGKQGLGKSSFFRLLVPDEDWFGEGPKLSEEPKRLLAQLQGKLIVEFGELTGMSKQNIDGIKKLITQQTDEYIANYARKATRCKRRAVFVGTVNGTEYLRDLTDNRRFPIIPVTKELDYEAIKAEKMQLWAEAMLEESLYGELRLSDEAVQDMRELQSGRLDVNTETEALLDEIQHVKHGYMTVDTIWERLGFPAHERSKRNGSPQYVFKEVKALMITQGWAWNKPVSVDGKSKRLIIKTMARGLPPEIICNGGKLVAVDEKYDDIEDLLS